MGVFIDREISKDVVEEIHSYLQKNGYTTKEKWELLLVGTIWDYNHNIRDISERLWVVVKTSDGTEMGFAWRTKAGSPDLGRCSDLQELLIASQTPKLERPTIIEYQLTVKKGNDDSPINN